MKLQRDSQPPQLAWLFVSPPVLDITTGDTKYWLDVYMYITDDGAGFSMAELTFSSSSEESGIRTFCYASLDLETGSVYAGVFKISFWFEDYDEGGLWQLRELILQDSDSNLRIYDSEDLFYFGPNVNSTVQIFGNHYVVCSDAERLHCEDRNAECKNVQPSMHYPESIFATCRCKQGYLGNSLVCVQESEMTDFLDRFERPHGTWHIPEQESPQRNENYDTSNSGKDSKKDSSQQNGGENPSEKQERPSEQQESEDRSSRSPTFTRPDYNPNPTDSNSQKEEEDGVSLEWSAEDSKVVGIVLACTLISGLCYQGVKHHKLLWTFAFLKRSGRRTNARIAPSRAALHGMASIQSPNDASNYAWRHDFTGSGRRQRTLPEWREPSGRDEAVDQRPNEGRRSRGARNPVALWDVDDLDPMTRAIFFSTELMQPHMILVHGAPQPPPPVALPRHLTLPGAVPVENIPEGQECAICMEARKSAVLMPCGHTDLCLGCAEHLLSNTSTAICPICRTRIHSVSKGTFHNE
eukprot:CAMPEP_0181325472 /NCGR_PEP_ID=MMETSP1101-20121128/20945_1 /TAXON_ID=46948 /ORGANISM="Rhodomonas abbreviata, Strain Caron Lab Isolate" /LENGTH=523 /DNA_ID=CAMNT_0023433785 /DNA_START=415 /DNA_END=1986 /DNA_ORIENTATION=+